MAASGGGGVGMIPKQRPFCCYWKTDEALGEEKRKNRDAEREEFLCWESGPLSGGRSQTAPVKFTLCANDKLTRRPLRNKNVEKNKQTQKQMKMYGKLVSIQRNCAKFN